jgi:dicarboxylate transporter 10
VQVDRAPTSSPATPSPSSSSPPQQAPRAATKHQPFWLGGVASMGAACCSHPLDLLKVRLQTASAAPAAAATVPPGGVASAAAASATPRQGLVGLITTIIRTDGVLSLYNGLSASLLRQGTYSTVRFGCYEALKERRLEALRAVAKHPTRVKDLPMAESIAFSMLAGSIGGVAGNPADLVNVRMQNDRKLAPEARRNYKNVFDGLARIARQDGLLSLWNGVGPNVARAALMTTGQLASYDYFKKLMVQKGFSDKNVGTHLTASCLAGVVATVITQPVDVVKTRMMNASPICPPSSSTQAPGGPSIPAAAAAAAARPRGDSAITIVRQMVACEGPQSLFKGFTPALTRLGPHTVATFLFLEQLKKLVS